MTTVDAINTIIKLNSIQTDGISDGYHTFGELYEHRIQLFIALCKIAQDNRELHDSLLHVTSQSKLKGEGRYGNVWRSRYHSDGQLAFGGGWFLLGLGEESGYQITYHLPENYWDKCEFAKTLKQAPEFDGHTSNDVIQRLKNL